jgi:hypothetical protein
MTATHAAHSITQRPCLHLALELSSNHWKLAHRGAWPTGLVKDDRHCSGLI